MVMITKCKCGATCSLLAARLHMYASDGGCLDVTSVKLRLDILLTLMGLEWAPLAPTRISNTTTDNTKTSISAAKWQKSTWYCERWEVMRM